MSAKALKFCYSYFKKHDGFHLLPLLFRAAAFFINTNVAFKSNIKKSCDFLRRIS